MKKVLKWIGIILGILIVVIIVSVYMLTRKADKMMVRKFEITPQYFSITSDSVSIARGKALSQLCKECHGEQLEGFAFFNDKAVGVLNAPNLTKGRGSATINYQDVDWIRSIRHGVRPNGDGLMVMPADDYANLSKEDIGGLISYLKTLPPVDHEPQKNYLTVLGKVLLATGQIGKNGELFAASVIDHSKPLVEAMPIAATTEYGEYVMNISGCKTCHGPQLNGGKSPNPNSPPVPNLTPAGNLSKWSAEQFTTTLRTGLTPEGKQLQKEFMPYTAFTSLSDEEMTALYMYIKTLPSVPTPKS